jgi:hypothetical protein
MAFITIFMMNQIIENLDNFPKYLKSFYY